MKKLALILFAAVLMMSCTKEDDTKDSIRAVEYSIQGEKITYTLDCTGFELNEMCNNDKTFIGNVTGDSFVSMQLKCHSYGDFIVTIKIDGVIVDYFEGRLYNNDVIFLSE